MNYLRVNHCFVLCVKHECHKSNVQLFAQCQRQSLEHHNISYKLTLKLKQLIHSHKFKRLRNICSMNNLNAINITKLELYCLVLQCAFDRLLLENNIRPDEKRWPLAKTTVWFNVVWTFYDAKWTPEILPIRKFYYIQCKFVENLSI